MIRSTATFLTAAGLLAGLAAASGTALAQTAAAGPFGQRVGNSYLPSTNDPNCVGLICNPLPASPSNPSVPATPPPCQGLVCSFTPYSMQPPYTASQAAEAERQRAAAQAQAQAAPIAPPAPLRHVRKHRKIAAMKAATRTAAPPDAAQ